MQIKSTKQNSKPKSIKFSELEILNWQYSSKKYLRRKINTSLYNNIGNWAI